MAAAAHLHVHPRELAPRSHQRRLLPGLRDARRSPPRRGAARRHSVLRLFHPERDRRRSRLRGPVPRRPMDAGGRLRGGLGADGRRVQAARTPRAAGADLLAAGLRHDARLDRRQSHSGSFWPDAGVPVAWQAHIIGFLAGVVLVGPLAWASGQRPDPAR